MLKTLWSFFASRTGFNFFPKRDLPPKTDGYGLSSGLRPDLRPVGRKKVCKSKNIGLFYCSNQYPTVMKSSNQPLVKETISEVRAKRAVSRIQKWMEIHYPVLASTSKARLIIECLIEINEENKFLSAQ